MDSYRVLNVECIAEALERANRLMNGSGYLDITGDYIETYFSSEEQMKGYLMIESLYKEIEPYLDEIKQDIEKKSPWTLNFELNVLEQIIEEYKVIKYTLNMERALGKSPNKNVSTVLPNELNTEEAKNLFSKIKWCSKDGNLYKWTGTKSLFGYFVDKTSDYLGIRPSNNRIPWDIYRRAFQFEDTRTAKQAVNDYRNKGLSEPEGFWEIKKLCS